MSRNSMSKYDQLNRGDSLLSNNGQFKAIFQDDGNFVIYGDGSKVVWATDTHGLDGDRLCMQEDCHLVMYNKDDRARWRTGAYVPGNHWTNLTLTDEGVLVVTKSSEELWSSQRNRGEKL